MKKKILPMLLLFALFSLSAYAQRTVTGTVKDDIGELLPGVSVVIVGTSQGSITDAVGNFSINVPGNDAVLRFSFVGMEAQEITVGNQSVISVVMVSSSVGMDEVVVTALGISRETKSLGYNVGNVDGDELTEVAQTNVMNSLAGRVSGVAINSTGGEGSSVSMVIRGATSLTSDNQPLFVVDGIPMSNTLNNVTEMARDTKVDYGNAISDINPEDIESISVLKGPSAAALYGSRAGNGVVLITTKSGRKSEGIGVTITSNTVIENPYKYLEKHNLMANGRRPYTQDNRPNNGLPYYSVPAGDSYWVGPELDKGGMAYQWPFFDANGDLVATELTSHPDNAKNFFQTGYTTTNGVSLTSSSERLNYRLSYNNMQNKGVIPNSDLHRNSLSLNSTVNLLKNLSVSTSINISNSGADNRPVGNRGANPMQALYETNSHLDILSMKDYWVPGQEGIQQRAPYNLVVNPDGTYGADDMTNNPYFLANEVNNPFTRKRVYGNARIDWEIIQGLSVMARYNHDQYNETRETKIAPSYSGEPNGFYGITELSRRETNADFLLSYDKAFENFNLTASFGGNYRYNYNARLLTQAKNRGTGLIIPNIYTISNVAPDNLTYASGYSEKAVYSLYGLVSLGYRNMVYLDLTGRNDWSSTLPAENRSYFYPSASLSVLFNNIFDMGSSVSLFKIRGGWAKVGNDTDPYSLLATMGKQADWGNLMRLSTSGTLLLPDLKPEMQTSWEIGTDLAFFSNRLRADFTYYQAQNENQILNIGLPPSSGFSSKQINAGLLESTGIELGIGGTPVRTSDWNWDVNFILSRNKTIIKELSEGFDYIRLWGDAKGGAYSWVGEEIGQMIDRALVRVEDENSPYYGWPIVDDEGWEDSDRTLQVDGKRVAPVIGNFNPKVILGLQTAVSYKRFTLSASLDWRIGGQFVSQTFRYGESDLHTQRWIDKVHDLSNISDVPAYLKENADQYLSPDGEFFVLVGGPTEDLGGIEFTEDGITLNDGVFMPGVEGYYDENDNFIMTRENLGDSNTPLIRYQDYYGWSYTRCATFDADFIKLREIALTYQLPAIKGIQNFSVSLYSKNIILWTKAGIGIDPERAFQPEGGTQTSGIQFKQGIERFNVAPWTIPIGIKLNISF